jgi:hypothetical protein
LMLSMRGIMASLPCLANHTSGRRLGVVLYRPYALSGMVPREIFSSLPVLVMSRKSGASYVFNGSKLRMVVGWVISDWAPIVCELLIAGVGESADPVLLPLEKPPRPKSQPSLLYGFRSLRSLMCLRNARSIGLIVPKEAAIMPMPGSNSDHIVTISTFPYQS